MIHQLHRHLLLCLAAALVAGAALPGALAAQSSPIDVLTEDPDTAPPEDNAGLDGRMRFMAGSREAKKGFKLAEKAAAESDAAAREELRKEAKAALEGAVPDLTAAIQLQPTSPDAYLMLGDVLRALGRHPDAINMHATAFTRLPKNGDNLRAWVDTMLAMHLFGDVSQLYDRLLAQYPEGARIVLVRVHDWVVLAKKSPPADLSAENLERLAQWVAARQAAKK